MQALNLGWPIGAIIGPLIAVPFVSEEEAVDTNATTTAYPLATEVGDNGTNMGDIGDIGVYAKEFNDESQIEIACWIGACLTIFIGSLHLALFAVIRVYYVSEILDEPTADQGGDFYKTIAESSESQSHQDTSTITAIKDAATEQSRNALSNDIEIVEQNDPDMASASLTWRDILTPSKWAAGDGPFGIKVAVLTVLFYMLLMFSAKGVGGYLVLYAVDSDLGFTNAEAAQLQSAVFVFAIIGDSTALVLAKYLSVNWMLFIQVHGQLIAGFLMLGVGTQSKVGLWVTSCLYTAVREPSFASGYTWSGLHIILYAFILSMISLLLGVFNIPMNALQGWLYTNTVIESIFYTTIFWGGLNCFALYVMIYLTYNMAPIQSILADKSRDLIQNNNNNAGRVSTSDDPEYDNKHQDAHSDTSCESDTSNCPLQNKGDIKLSTIVKNQEQDKDQINTDI